MHSSLRVCLAPGGLGALLIVLGLGFGGGRRPRRCMSLLALYQQTQAEVISSKPARVSSGPVLNGEPSRMHSVLYRPIVVSARALSNASPTVPIEGRSPASIRVSVK